MSETHLLPQGFRAAGIYCGIKSNKELLDLALFVSDAPCSSAGVFTQNKVVGAPVKVSRERVGTDSTRAVVINSGNSNACTGERGMEDARWMTELAAKNLNCAAGDVLVCSTGVIGHFLPREALETGIPRVVEKLGESAADLELAARAIMTTDTRTKQSSREVPAGSGTVRVSGVAKGAAMIGPNMATMLAVIMTDAQLTPAQTDTLLRHAVDRSFNCISVEGHTSTSDTVFLLANGASNTALDDSALAQFGQAIDEVATDLARAIIEDAEGADHLITIDVVGLPSEAEAKAIAKEVADSALVKTAITGADPNWGRIVSAAGYSGVEFFEEDCSLKINGTLIYEKGQPLDYDEAALSKQIRDNRDVSIELIFTLGEAATRYWTSDLTAEYVRLNSEYTT